MNNPEPVVALVVAAGSGVRLGGAVPKALRLLDGEPLVLHALRRLAAGGIDRAVVVIRPDERERFDRALTDLERPTVDLVAGGAERQDSVRAGLDFLAEAVPSARIVLVHDAARPLVDPATVRRVVSAVAAGAPAVVPAVAVVDTIRQREPDGSSVGLDRSRLMAVQTPQGFDLDLLRRAHAAVAADGVGVTDDAGACEHLGTVVTTVPGSPTGLKITHSDDLVVAEALLRASTAAPSNTAAPSDQE